MNENLKKEILKAVKEKSMYDFIAQNYYKLDKETLAAIAKEYIFALETISNHSAAYIYQEDALEEIEEELNERI